MDFMTEGGQSHPVWWDDQTKWHVWLGGNIQGEVRVRYYPKTTTNLQPGSKLQRLTDTARAYNCNMNIYGNNCRIFCARMEREVTRLNNAENNNRMLLEEDDSSSNDDHNNNGLVAGWSQKVATAKQNFYSSDYAADGLMVWRIIGAVLLPALYPLLILCACWGSIR